MVKLLVEQGKVSLGQLIQGQDRVDIENGQIISYARFRRKQSNYQLCKVMLGLGQVGAAEN